MSVRPMSVRPMRVRVLSAVLLGLCAAGGAAAHEGHSHGDEPKPVAVSTVPALEASSSEFELVAVPNGPELVIHLDRFATNEPVSGAVIEVSADGATAAASEAPDGTYRAPAPWAARPGSHEATFTILTEDAADLLIGTLDIPDPAAEAPVAGAIRVPAVLGDMMRDPGLMIGAAMAFLLGSLATLAFTLRGRVRVAAVAAVIGLASLLVGGTAFANADENPGDGKAAASAFPADPPRRLPDGSLHVPKRTQRLLEVRTMVAAEGEAAATVRLMGRIVPDPNFAGHVQASQSGRIEPGEKGLPYLGQRVEAGQVLAYVVPAVTSVDRSGVQQQIAQVEKEIAIAEARLERLNAIAANVPRAEIDEARKTLAGLERQRDALRPALTTREALPAPVSGVVAAANVVVGQFVDGRDQVLFEIVDPDRLMVEAMAFDAAAVADPAGASAVTADGKGLDLAYVGLGPALRQQAIPLLFRIQQAPAGLKVEQPVTVLVRNRAREAGIVLPRRSVVRGADGQPMVWEHDSPQRFIARPVRMRPVDADTVIVQAGVAPGARVVTDGAGLLNQVR